VIGPFNQVMAS